METIASAGAAALTAQVFKDDGATVLATQTAPVTGFTSFASQATNIEKSKPDLVVSIDDDPDTPIIVPAMRTAGFTGPVLGSQGANDDAQYYALRYYNAPSSTLLSAAKAAGVSAAGPHFTAGWTEAEAAAAAYASCGGSCPLSSFITAMQTIKGSSVPGSPTPGPIGFSASKHLSPNYAQFFGWSTTKNAVVAPGSVLNMSDVSGIKVSS